MSNVLFIASLLLGLVSIPALGFTLVRLVLQRLRASPLPTTEPPRVTWLSPIVLIPLALMGMVSAALILILAFWVGCTADPDLC